MRDSALRIIDLLSLRPGALLRLNAVTGEAGCRETEAFRRRTDWRRGVTSALLPGADAVKARNFEKLLEIPVAAAVMIRGGGGKVIEIHRLCLEHWESLLARAGCRAELLVDGRVVASGDIVDDGNLRGIRITEVNPAETRRRPPLG